jgi:Protein of unknown function (DUF3105)
MNGKVLGLVLAVVLAVVAIGAALVVPRLLDDDDDGRTGDVATGSTSLDEVVTTELVGSHEPGDHEYDESPPMGGVHNDPWLDCGVYDRPVREEITVHSLEHGTVWITYDPDLSDEDVEALEAKLPDKGILSPYDGLSSPVVVTVWNHQLALTGADDSGLDAFLDEYGDGANSPEPFASCAGGVEEFED